MIQFAKSSTEYRNRRKCRRIGNRRKHRRVTRIRGRIRNIKNCDLDSEDLQGAAWDDALDTIEGKNRTERIAMWPNEAYREFMELIIEGNISNKMGEIGR